MVHIQAIGPSPKYSQSIDPPPFRDWCHRTASMSFHHDVQHSQNLQILLWNARYEDNRWVRVGNESKLLHAYWQDEPLAVQDASVDSLQAYAGSQESRIRKRIFQVQRGQNLMLKNLR